LSVNPPAAGCAEAAACGVPGACTVAVAGVVERLHDGQEVAPSGIWVPHALQKAMISSLGSPSFAIRGTTISKRSAFGCGKLSKCRA
jgi:hypothetical protein